MRTILDDLIENNEFPLVFIGSGISKRYLDGFPNWTGLLEEFWNAVGFGLNFYGEFNKNIDSLKAVNPGLSEKELEHYSNIRMGTILEESFNEAFNSGSITLPNFNQKDAYQTKISPFKMAISKRFSQYTIKEKLLEEYNSFKNMLMKTQIILTTNYDCFIENSYNEISRNKVTKYIGQKGFFQETFGSAELYKLHGCVESPTDIVISEKDYERFDKNSVLISAKIISMMMHSPIIFMGYSLTDVNVRKIISDFTRSLNDQELQILENRLIIIERKQGEDQLIQEVISERDLGCKLKVIKTDNYKLIYDKISKINQGIAPTELRKYQQIVKKLIVDRGKKGTLKSVLISPEELDNLEENIQNRNLVVALGDAKYIFQIPDIVSYCLDYISDTDEISNDTRMRFAVSRNGRFPINKILDENLIENSNLHTSEKAKLINKISECTNFDEHYDSINQSSILTKRKTSVEEICKMDSKRNKIYATISYHIKDLELETVKRFLIANLADLKDKGEISISTELRRLLLLYDILVNAKGATTNQP
ncbi:hypothetical protein BHU72_14680 [Desulfuribacillus stibiiarsenatis]|uniref:Uncharacterized protein n=1 Tax=Desulfuribacillus stibiiarsenatis TaxID=1390249 RepID=A0A1E5L7D4_9FIRM|nr:SIR2 family protein [Desulfuribacillus stibiiarsenatis]OEH86072.1 hypothetical protein BHU72_14680 [Desulfuribacillus stibiiarsenatis]